MSEWEQGYYAGYKKRLSEARISADRLEQDIHKLLLEFEKEYYVHIFISAPDSPEVKFRIALLTYPKDYRT